jgi:glutathione S-transferase
MLQLYGSPRSRALRCLWMLEEMGEPYQLIEKSTRPDELQTVEYLCLNPNARIPTLVDGDFVLWESMAINLYLAQKYLGPMHCVDAKALGLAAHAIHPSYARNANSNAETQLSHSFGLCPITLRGAGDAVCRAGRSVPARPNLFI